MRLLFYIHSLCGGGAERVLCTLANSLVDKGYEIIIATNNDTKSAYKLDKRIKVITTYKNITFKDVCLLFKIVRYIKKLTASRRIAKQVKPDIIISFIRSKNIEIITATAGLGIPVICSEHSCVGRKPEYKVDTLWKLLYPLATTITLLTRYDYRNCRSSLRNVVYMPNPVPLEEYNCCRPKQKVILAAGRVNAWKIKGFDSLIRYWGILSKEFPDWKLFIAGHGDDDIMSYLNTLAVANNCSNIHLLGFRNDVKEIMESSEIFVLTSRIEGLPMVLIEAMAAGCCCVSFDCKTGPREIIHDGVSGLLVKDQDDTDMIEKLRKAMSEPEYRSYLASNTLQSIRKYYVDNVISRWEILFKKITERN